MNNLIESPGHTATLRRLRAAIQAWQKRTQDLFGLG